MTLEQYKTIINAYLDFYPDDRVDIQLNDTIIKQALNDDAEGNEVSKDTLDYISSCRYNSLNIITYYPSLTLTNDSGKQYTVYGIYVKTAFPEFIVFMGRTIYNTDEIKVGYRHSHISRSYFTEISDFCTGGNDTPINKMASKYMRNEYGNFETFIQSFIIEVERMIRIESNAGGPYITFNEVGKTSVNTPLRVKLFPRGYTGNLRNKDIFLKFIDYYCSLRLDDFYYDGRNWQLADTDTEFIKRVTKVAKTWKKTANANIYQNINIIHGLYYAPTSNGRYSVRDGEMVYWTFKGEHPRIKIINKGNGDDIKRDTIVDINLISTLYSFMLNLINGVYANQDKYKDSIHSRAYKIKTALIKAM